MKEKIFLFLVFLIKIILNKEINDIKEDINLKENRDENKKSKYFSLSLYKNPNPNININLKKEKEKEKEFINQNNFNNFTKFLLLENKVKETNKKQDKNKLHENSIKNFIKETYSNLYSIQPIKIKNFYNMQYYTNLIIGSNKQEFSVIIDTGSNVLWLPSSNCQVENCRNYTEKFSFLESSSSKNLNKTLNITYGKGFVDGNLISDNVFIDENFGVKDFNFLLVDKELDLEGTISDGLLGLGNYKENDRNFSFIYGLYTQGLISKPIFTFYLTDSIMSNRLYLGDIRENHQLDSLLNNTQKCKVNNDSSIYSNYWACDILSISTSNETFNKDKLDYLNDNEEKNYNENEYNNNNIGKRENVTNFRTLSKAIFDTGTSIVFIPINDFIELIPFLISKAKLNICTLSQNFQIFCKCNNPSDFGSIYMNFENGNKFVIDFESIIDYIPGNEYECAFQVIIEIFGMDTWILGDSVLRYTFLTFDMENKQISFLQNALQITDSEIKGENNLNENGENNFSQFIYQMGIYIAVFSLGILLGYALLKCLGK
jgi:hypothetical protein